jgi:hypothetical protein
MIRTEREHEGTHAAGHYHPTKEEFQQAPSPQPPHSDVPLERKQTTISTCAATSVHMRQHLRYTQKDNGPPSIREHLKHKKGATYEGWLWKWDKRA